MRIPIKNTDAAILVEQNKDLIVDKVKLPDELKIGQILVEIHVSGICGSQLGEISGVKGKDKFLPHLLGHEGCATVLTVGPGVKTVSKGDLVVLHWRKGEGIQSETPVYTWKGKKVNAGWLTTFNKYAIISENRCTSIPKNTDKDLAALFGCAITTGFGVIENNAKLMIGESIVVYGAGGIGLNIIQAATLSSGWPIIAVDLFDSRLNLAKSFGATHLINAKKSDTRNQIIKILGKRNLDVFIDNTGIPEIIEMGYEIMGPKGRMILVGVPRINSNIKIYSLPLHFGKSIIGSHGGESKPHDAIPRYLNLYNNDIWGIEGLVSERYKLKDINSAILSMKSGNRAGRIIIDL